MRYNHPRLRASSRKLVPVPLLVAENDLAVKAREKLLDVNSCSRSSELVALVLVTLLAVLVAGYHPGLEDDAFYLAAIKKNLNPSLFPYDPDFFRLEFQTTIFDKLIAYSISLTHLPLGWGILLWQFVAIFLVLWGCYEIARRFFSQGHARWAAVIMVALLLTLPVSGTGITLADQYLHPRTLATAAILGAVAAVLEDRRWPAAMFLALAFSVHALMAAFGISYCVFLAWPSRRLSSPRMAALLLPLGWVFAPASDAWRQAAASRPFYLLREWSWYEWLGVFAPLLLLWWFRRIAERDGALVMARAAERLVYFGIFQIAVGLVIMLPRSLERLWPFEPMRGLHLLYLFLFLMAGGLIGQHVLGRHVYRWLLLFVPLSLGMMYTQCQMYPATAHLELPGEPSKNAWVDAFTWVRHNTPTDSLFALDPYYMSLPGEDFHGFRALAERSALADYLKDGGMAARVPVLAERWQKEVKAGSGWKHFQLGDFRRLQTQMGVNWVILASPGVPGMECPYHNRAVFVCRLN